MVNHREKYEKILAKIVKLLKETLEPEKIILFGSRAKGNFAPYSDIDLAIEGVPQLSIRDFRKLKEKIETISWPFFVDLVFLEKVDEEFKNIINETGRIIYEKNRNTSKYK
jgi:predicted nucleotidyltransferase